MINYRVVVGFLGALFFALGLLLVIPMLIGITNGDENWWAFGGTAVIGIVVGAAIWTINRPDSEIRPREGFAIVVGAWVGFCLLGAVPFVWGGVLESYTDAFFETMSGLTTTGATIFGAGNNPQIEDLPDSFLFWRSFTQWIGGMGMIVLAVALLPMLGVGGMQLFKAEVPGPSTEKITPRLRETARRLWLIYVGITVVEILLLLPEMTFFEATNHAFTTMSTGGFSTRNASVAAYNSLYVDVVITIFMFLGGINFYLYYRVTVTQRFNVFWTDEFRTYLAFFGGATIVVSLCLFAPITQLLPSQTATTFEGYDSLVDAFRFGSFQVVSILTTTGFATADYELWPVLPYAIIFLLFFTGGMAGSTAGGIKMMRLTLLFKHMARELKLLLHPNAIVAVRLDDRVVQNGIMRTIVSFTVLYVTMGMVGFVTMSAMGLDLDSAIGVVISCLGNVGPAFGDFGPTEVYTSIPALGKWVLSALMLIGRLEIYTVLILFMTAYWQE